MTELVQVALAEDIAEAEELQTILERAGIASELETAVEHHPQRPRTRHRRCWCRRSRSRPRSTRSRR